MENLKQYFHFNRHERNGAIILCILCVATTLIPPLIYPLIIPEETLDYRKISPAVRSLSAEQPRAAKAALFSFDPNTASPETFRRLQLSDRTISAIINYRSKGGKFRNKADFKKIYALRAADYTRLAPYIDIRVSVPEKQELIMVNFDPNTATAETLQQLGIPERAVRAIINYREKGGKYRKKEDVKKIYSLPEAEYLRIAPYIHIGGAADTLSVRPGPIRAMVSIDINTATVEEWRSLRGIGPAYAAKIVRFRELLGGFISVEQVAETRHLPDSTYQQIAPQLTLSPIFRPLLINELSVDSLAAHPYIDRKSAQAMVAWRTQNGPFSGFEDLSKLYGLSAETKDKIKPYLVYKQ